LDVVLDRREVTVGSIGQSESGSDAGDEERQSELPWGVNTCTDFASRKRQDFAPGTEDPSCNDRADQDIEGGRSRNRAQSPIGRQDDAEEQGWAASIVRIAESSKPLAFACCKR
jgi:hypothetical protein